MSLGDVNKAIKNRGIYRTNKLLVYYYHLYDLRRLIINLWIEITIWRNFIKCIKCENPALHESDFCAACEEKELSGIGGFLYFSAINIIFAILSSLFGSYKTMTILISGYDFLGELRILIGFEFIPVIFQVASLLAALAHPGYIVTYAPGDSLSGRRDIS